MPEILTKAPDIVLSVLSEGGAQCAAGVQPLILTACPPDRFCAFPTGEICVFGFRDFGRMTQISPDDFRQVADGFSSSPPVLSIEGGVVLMLIFVAGLIAGTVFSRKRQKEMDRG